MLRSPDSNYRSQPPHYIQRVLTAKKHSSQPRDALDHIFQCAPYWGMSSPSFLRLKIQSLLGGKGAATGRRNMRSNLKIAQQSECTPLCCAGGVRKIERNCARPTAVQEFELNSDWRQTTMDNGDNCVINRGINYGGHHKHT